MTAMRSESESTSSSSEETSSTARPGVPLRDDLLVDELDRADVEAACRLAGDQHLRLGAELAGDDDLLLVAAAERSRLAASATRPGCRML